MIRLPSREDERIVLEALRSENPGALTEWEFWAGSRLLNGRTESLSYGREGGMPVALDATLSGALSPSVKGDKVTVDVIVAGVPVRRFTGRAHKPKTEDFKSQLLANTAGWWAGVNSLRAVKFYSGYTARQAAIENLLSLPYTHTVDVAESKMLSKDFQRDVDDPFEKTQVRKDVLDAITEETKCVFTDTRLNGVRGRMPRPAPLASEAAWTFRTDRDTTSFTYSPKAEEYKYVQSYRVLPNGDEEDLSPLTEIPGSEAPEDAIYWILIEDETVGAYTEGRKQVNEAATNLVHGESEGTIVIPWIHVLLEEGDVVAVEEVTDDEDDLILRHWLCRVDQIQEDPYEMQQTLEWTGTYREERVSKALLPSAAPLGSLAVIPI